MILLSAALLLLALGRVVVGQCEYVYVAEPPSGQLICDPFPTNQLQLVCSIFVADVGQPDTLRIQWFFSAPENRQFNPANAVLLEEVQFDVTITKETYTSRIVVSLSIISWGYDRCSCSSYRRTPLINNNLKVPCI